MRHPILIMATISEVNNNWQRLDIDTEVINTIKSNSERMLTLNKEQLKEGFDKQGKRLREYRSDLYAQVKNRMNPLPGYGNPDLFKTGAFFEEFTLRVEQKVYFYMYSQDAKYFTLVKNYGKDIFGLGDRKREDLIEGGFRDDLVKRVKSVVRL